MERDQHVITEEPVSPILLFRRQWDEMGFDSAYLGCEIEGPIVPATLEI